MRIQGRIVLAGALVLVSGGGGRAQDLEGEEHLMEYSCNYFGEGDRPAAEERLHRLIAGMPAVCPAPEGIEVARIHERSQRLFVIVTPETVKDRQQAEPLLRRVAEYVGRCHSHWADRWWVTFMADAKLAGFKTEPEILPHVKNGGWSRGYLGEYEHRRGVLVRFPLIPERRDELEIHLGG